MFTELAVEESEILQNQVERILRSEELHGSEVLRRLLRFLADKSVSGEADELKEYVVAIDGLGKPVTYDPRHNSAVRIQVGRLRQKLADYYRGEGQEDPIVIDVPKGRFKLKFEHRTCAPLPTPPAEPFHEHVAPAPPAAEVEIRKKSWKEKLAGPRFAIPLWLGLIVLAGIAGSHWIRPSNAKATAITYPPGWDADMEDLWRPFISNKKPVIVAIEDPLFVELNGATGIYYRDRTLNNWNDIVSSRNVAGLRKALNNPIIQPSRYYTAFGEVDASFMLAKLLGPRELNLSVMKTSELSLREIGDNNILFVGVQNLFFSEQAQAMPVQIQLQQVREGIRNQNPGPNEPELFADQYSTAPTEEGIAYALVTHLPGPMGDNDVESFTSSRSAGYVAAVKSFTDPDVVHTVVNRLKQSCGGRMPRYYQVLLKVKFKEQVPTGITYVLGRELH